MGRTKIRKRILSCVIAIILILTTFPATVWAKLGALILPEPGDVKYETFATTAAGGMGYRNSVPEGAYHILYNDYLTFVLRPNGMSSTLPTRALNEEFKTRLMGNKWEIAKYLKDVPVTEFPTLYADSGMEIQLNNKFVGTPQITYVGDNEIQAIYKIETDNLDKPVTYTVNYKIVKLDEGATSGQYGGGMVDPDPNDSGRTWGVRARATVEYEGTRLYNANENDNGDNYGAATFTMITEHVDFAQNRSSGEQGAIQLSQTSYEYDEPTQVINYWNSSVKLPRTEMTTESGHTTEFFTSSFGIDNQFVAVGNGYIGGWGGSSDGMKQISGIRGHAEYDEEMGLIGGNYGEIATYKPEEAYTHINGAIDSKRKTLKVYSTANLYASNDETKAGTLDALWGYRDLYTDSEANLPEEKTNYTEVKNGGYLGLVKDSSGKITAVEGTNIDSLKNTYGNKLIAVLRGNWTREGTLYQFSGNVALSSTVTLTPIGTNSTFTVSEEGAITINDMGISCPAFQFYTPKGSTGVTFDYQNSSAGKLKLIIDPKTNDSILHLDIPGATSVMNGVEIGLDGSLVFSGTMGIETPVLEILGLELNRVGMGYKNNNYTVNGIEASGQVSMPDILGLPIPSNSASAYINTFDGEETYAFELSIEVPNLFESEASLTLVRLNNGALVPDDLSLHVGSEVGVPLVPPIIIGELTGIGGGFSDLASTVNGDFFAAPPLKLSLSADAELFEMLSGKGTMTVGMGYYGTKLSDPKLFDRIGFDAEYSDTTYFGVEQRMWDEEVPANYVNNQVYFLKYTGIAIGGEKRLDIHLPSEDCNIINISSGLSIDAFTGTAWNPQRSSTSILFEINGDGYLDTSLNFPKKIGSLKVPLIGGKTLARTKIQMIMGLKALYTHSDNMTKDIIGDVEHASMNASLLYKKEVLGADVWLQALLGQKRLGIGINTAIGGLDTSISLGKASNAKLLSAGETDDMYYAIYSGSNMDSLVSTINTKLKSINVDDEILAQLAKAGVTMAATSGSEDLENSYDITLSEDAKAEQLLIMLTPKEDEYTNEELEKLFSVKDANGNVHTFIFEEYDDEWESLVPNANAYISASGIDDITGEYVQPSLVMKLPKNGTWTISAQDAFDVEIFSFELSEDIDDETGKFENLKENKEYVLRGYLVDETGDFHMVGSANANEDARNQIILDDGDNITKVISELAVGGEIDSIDDFVFGDEYTNVAGGTYKKVYTLLEKITTEETGDYYIPLDTYEGEEIRVKNPNEIPAPTSVKAESIGSEILRAQWEAPKSMPEGKSIDGYAVTIYEKNSDGEWVSANTGYEVRADETGKVPTIVDMSLTIGGSGDIDGDGNVDDGYATLEADKTYRISVETLSDITADLDGDGEEETVAQRSAATYSDEAGVFIPKATPPKLSYSPTPEVVEGSNMKTLYVRTDEVITVTSSENVTMSAVRMDDNSILAEETETDELNITVPEFEGSLIIQIDAKDVQGDMTRDYISLKKDKVAPVMTLDREVFYADKDGNFTITGVAEAGVEISIDHRGEIEMLELDEAPFFKDNVSVIVNEDGTFEVSGKLSESTRSDGESAGGALLYLNAADHAGNAGDWIYAVVLYEEEVELPYEDVTKDDWFYDAVRYNYIKETMTGMDATHFGPYGQLSRAQFALILYRIEGQPTVETDKKFHDISGEEWYGQAVLWAAEKGIVTGYENGNYGPVDLITREQMAVMMYRYAKYLNRDVSKMGDLSVFKDASSVSPFATEAMSWAYGMGIITGKENGTLLDPQGATARAEAAAIIQRFMTK